MRSELDTRVDARRLGLRAAMDGGDAACRLVPVKAAAGATQSRWRAPVLPRLFLGRPAQTLTRRLLETQDRVVQQSEAARHF